MIDNEYAVQWDDDCGHGDSSSLAMANDASNEPNTDSPLPKGMMAVTDTEEERIHRIEESQKDLAEYRKAMRAKMMDRLTMERKTFISPMFKVNSLFTEAGNWEIRRIRNDSNICDDEKKLLIRDIIRSYRSLITDVEDVIKARLPTGVDKEESITEEAMKCDYRYQHRKPEELKAALMTIADEAISFHSTMLPFSDGILSKDRLPIAQEAMLKRRMWIEDGLSSNPSSSDDDIEDVWYSYNAHHDTYHGHGRRRNAVILSIAASTPLSQAKKSKLLAKRTMILDMMRQRGHLFIGCV